MQGRGLAPLLCTLNSAKAFPSNYGSQLETWRKLPGKVTFEKKSDYLVSPTLTTLILHSEEKRQNSDLPFWKISVMILN